MPEVASQTFELVGREVNVTLAAARGALESYVEQPDNDALRAEAKTFYERLLRQNDRALEDGNLPRAEVQGALTELGRK